MADWGILDHLTTDEELMARAMDLAGDYAAKPPLAVQMIKQSTNQLAYALGNSIMHMDSDQNLLAASSEDREKAIQGKLNNESRGFTGN
jgi:enoyl-CoA hydratase/carnithine racemase